MVVSRFLILILLLAIDEIAFGQPAGNQNAPGTLEQLRALPAFRGVSKLEELHQGAIKGLEQYRLMVNAQNFRMLGLERAADASKTGLGTPFRDYLVRLDKLREYKSGDDPATLLSDTGMVHYPVVFDNATRGTVTLAMQQGVWRVASIGEANRSQERSIALKESARRLNKAEGSYFTVRVPALNVEFVAVQDSSNQLQLTPIQDFSEWELRAGVPEPASSVFLKLVPAAKEHDGLPR